MSWTALLEGVLRGADTVRSQVAGQSRLSAVSGTLSAQQLREGLLANPFCQLVQFSPACLCTSLSGTGVSSKQHHFLLHVLC